LQKFAKKIRLAVLWLHSTGCSGAVTRLINMQQQMNLGQ